MKMAQLLLLLISCAIAKAQVVSNNPSAPALTNTLAIYLLAGARKPALEDNKLEPKPVLADHDFVAYDTNTQRLAIRAEAAKRLCRGIKEKAGYTQPQFIEPRVRGDGRPSYGFDWPDTPFVLQALEERVCVGEFSSDLSSFLYDVPLIKPVKLFIHADSTNDVQFRIENPRNDKRIIAAFERLFQITNTPSKNTLK
jgi:hypothetical protein